MGGSCTATEETEEDEDGNDVEGVGGIHCSIERRRRY